MLIEDLKDNTLLALTPAMVSIVKLIYISRKKMHEGDAAINVLTIFVMNKTMVDKMMDKLKADKNMESSKRVRHMQVF